MERLGVISLSVVSARRDSDLCLRDDQATINRPLLLIDPICRGNHLQGVSNVAWCMSKPRVIMRHYILHIFWR